MAGHVRDPEEAFRERYGLDLPEAVDVLYPVALDLTGGRRIEATDLVVGAVRTMLTGPWPTGPVRDVHRSLRLQLVRHAVELLHKGRPVDDLWRRVEDVVGVDDARLLWMHFVEGFSFRDMAATPPPTTPAGIATRVARAVRRLRDHREGNGP